MPIVIDIETGGINCNTDALLEIAAFCIKYDKKNKWQVDYTRSWHEHIIPFHGSNCHAEALECNKIIPDHPLRFAIPEKQALLSLKDKINLWLKESKCKRGVLVGHNAHFDLNFLMQAVYRCDINKFPLHSFTCFDTATLGGMFFKKTVLAQIMRQAKIKFDIKKAHGALYDAEKTAELFCYISNIISDKLL